MWTEKLSEKRCWRANFMNAQFIDKHVLGQFSSCHNLFIVGLC
jgi:hypothetical protein